MIVNGVDYRVTEEVEIKELVRVVPVLDILFLSDERWTALTNTPQQIELRKQLGLMREGDLNG